VYIESFKQLIVWQKAVELVWEIYRLTSQFPRSELFGLTNQMRRAAVAIPSNIAEGKKRRTKKDFLQFLRIADGSAAELETQIVIARKLFPEINFVNTEGLLEEVQKMLTTMVKKLESSTS